MAKQKNVVTVALSAEKGADTVKVSFDVQGDWTFEQLQAVARNGYLAAIKQTLTKEIRAIAPSVKKWDNMNAMALDVAAAFPDADPTIAEGIRKSWFIKQGIPLERPEIPSSRIFTPTELSGIEVDDEEKDDDEKTMREIESATLSNGTIADAILSEVPVLNAPPDPLKMGNGKKRK
jgi:hypothetical protein